MPDFSCAGADVVTYIDAGIRARYPHVKKKGQPFMLPTSSSANPRAVNDLLHTLRGERFRRSQNEQGSRTHISTAFSHNSPTLPVNLAHADYSTLGIEPVEECVSHSSAYKNCPGPGPPKSWTLTTKQAVHNTPVWRAQALSVVLPPPSEPTHQTFPPSLVNLCLQILASSSNQEFTEDIAPHLPPHLRRDLIRYTAVHSPLLNPRLYALYEPDRHADNELLIVGPDASLREDFFIRGASNERLISKVTESWDSEDQYTPEPLSTFILMSTRLPTSSLLSLPPTITKMALINLPTPISVHRLPGTCPLLAVLDLSYNKWLVNADNAEKMLERVEWSRWNRLSVLGLRECHISNAMVIKLNKGRWDDVEVVQ